MLPFATEIKASTRRPTMMRNLRPRAAQLFNIQHETGDLSEWDSTVTDSGDLSARLTAGLRNDLAVVGAELVTNGDFAAWTTDDPDSWTVAEALASGEVSEVGSGEGHGGVGTGSCNIFSSDGAAAANIRQTLTTEVGKTYQLTFDITTMTDPEIVVSASNPTIFEAYSTAGTKKIIFEAEATSFIPIFNRSGISDITIDNVSCKEVTGATYGMECQIDDGAAIYGQMNIDPPASGALRGRFYVDASQMEMAEADRFRMLRIKGSGTTQVALVQLEFSSLAFRVRITYYNDDDSFTADVSTIELTGEHAIEFRCLQATTSVASDGTMDVWIDGVLAVSVAGSDNFDRWTDEIKELRFGAVSAVDAGTRGRLFLDELVVRDDNRQIGA